MTRSYHTVLLAVVACNLSLAQDVPITTPAATITILTTEYNASPSGSPAVCSVFPAKSIMNSVTQTLNIGSQSSGAGAGKVAFNPFTIVKNVDSCSATLLLQTASGTPFQEVIAIVEPPLLANGRPNGSVPTYLVRLGLAAAATLNDSASDGTTLLEKITFDYGDLTIAEVIPASGATSCGGWDRVKNIRDTSNCAELTKIAMDRFQGKTR